jgi:CHAT domain-containing protein/Tfp pilus assembly protein PilF
MTSRITEDAHRSPLGLHVVTPLITVASLVCFLLMSASWGVPFSVQIERLRAEGKHAEALEVALDFLQLDEDPGVYPASIAIMKVRVATLRFILSLPESARREMTEADSLFLAMDHQWQAGNFSTAEALARRRLELQRRHLPQPHDEVAWTLYHLANCVAPAGDLAQAETLLHQALEMQLEVLGPENAPVGITLEHLGMVRAAQGDFAQAEGFYRQALETYWLITGENRDCFSGDENVLRTWRRMAKLHVIQGDYARAIPILRRAEAGARRFEARRNLDDRYWLTATLLNDLAVVLERQGDYSAAEPLYREALAIRRRALGEEHPHVIGCLTALGEVLCRSHQAEAARPLLQEALARSRRSLGNEDPQTAAVFLSLATLMRSTGHFAVAESLAHEALTIQRLALGEEHLDVAKCLSHLAHTCVARGEPDEAEDHFRQALSLYENLLDNEHPLLLRTTHELARSLLAQREPSAAESLLSHSATAFETARLRAGSGYSRATFQTSPYTALAASRLVSGKENEAWPAAERALGRVLADLIVTAGHQRLSSREIAVRDSLARVLGRLENQLSALREATRTNRSDQVAEDSRTLRVRLAEAESAWSAFQREIVSRHPGSEGHAFPLERVQNALTERTALMGWVHLWLSPGELLSWGYVIRRDGAVRWVRLDDSITEDAAGAGTVTAGELREALAVAASWFVRPIDVARLDGMAAELWERWVAPATAHLDGVDHLVVVPSGPLLGIPLESLVDSTGTYLADRYAISYAPSATLYAWLREQGSQADRAGSEARRALLAGDPPFTADHLTAMESGREEASGSDELLALAPPRIETTTVRSALAGNQNALANLPRLPQTREEVERIARVIPEATVLLGAEASEQRLVDLAASDELREFDTIHLATHALMDDRFPERSALVLSRVGLPDSYEAAMSGERIYDGLLTAKEIVREWQLEADLVTLSGCQTGLGKEAAGEGYIGLAHAFLEAGARSVLVSLWKVEDRATAMLMQRFYQNLTGTYDDDRVGKRHETMSKAEALREAKYWLRTYVERSGLHGEASQPFVHPGYWSGFVLIGES